MIRLHINWKGHVACNSNCLIEIEGLLKVTGIHVPCKCDKNSETVNIETLLLQTTNRK